MEIFLFIGIYIATAYNVHQINIIKGAATISWMEIARIA